MRLSIFNILSVNMEYNKQAKDNFLALTQKLEKKTGQTFLNKEKQRLIEMLLINSTIPIEVYLLIDQIVCAIGNKNEITVLAEQEKT